MYRVTYFPITPEFGHSEELERSTEDFDSLEAATRRFAELDGKMTTAYLTITNNV